MTNTTTCHTCVHFDAAHDMCLASIVQTSIGPVFATRTSHSPACWANYSREYQPGEISLLFEQNKISSIVE